MNKMLCLLSFLLPLVSAHMIMVEPPALGLKTNKFTQENDVDYSLSSPLTSQSDFPCKGKLKYIGTPSGQSVATWAAGSSQSFSLQAGAPHNGGSCQASISEDGGKTWKVLKSYVGGCPSAATVGSASTDTVEPFTVPKGTKNGDVVFAWTWFNNEGNREMYMNCAVVTITGGGSTPGLNDLPDTFVANVGNGCTTQDNANVLFPNPGSDVDNAGTGVPPIGTCGTSGSGSSPASGASSAAVATSVPVAGTSTAAVATSVPVAGTSTAAVATSVPVAGTSTAAVETEVTTSAVAPIASTSVPYGAGVNNGASTSVTYNNGLYTAGVGAASRSSSVSTIVPTVVSPAVSTIVPTVVSPAVSTSVPTAVSPAVSTSVPTAVSPAVSTSVPAVVSPAVSSVVSPPANTIPGTASTPCESSIMPAATETVATSYGSPVASGYPVASGSIHRVNHGSAASGTAIPDCKRSVRYTRSEPKVIPRSPGCMCQCSGGGTPQLIGQCS